MIQKGEVLCKLYDCCEAPFLLRASIVNILFFLKKINKKNMVRRLKKISHEKKMFMLIIYMISLLLIILYLVYTLYTLSVSCD